MNAKIKTFTINNKPYSFRNIDFNGVCELEDLGVDFNSIKSRSMSLMRSLLAFHSGLSVDEAGNEIMEHLANGGKFEDFTPMVEHLNDSDFFRLFSQSKGTETTQSKDKAQG